MSRKFSRLSTQKLKLLNAGESITEHGISALGLKNGDVRYSINIMVDRQRVHRVIGTSSEGVTRTKAEQAIESIRTKAREGRLNLPAGRKVHRAFGETANDYLNRLIDTVGEGQRGFKDIRNKRRHITDYLIPYFGSKRIDQISSFLVQHYIKHRLDQGSKQATVNRELSTLSHMMNRSVEWGWIKDSDKPEIKKGEEPSKKIVVLTDKTAADLYQGAIADQDSLTWLFVVIGLNSAMRHSEILRIRWEDVDFEQRRIHLEKAKAGQRTQPISESLATMLLQERNQREDQEGWIFPSQKIGTKFQHRRSMHRQFQRAVVRAGLNPSQVTPHVMRHTGITRLVTAGVDLPTIQKISGHKTMAMVLRYVHLSDQHIDEAMAAIDTGLFEQITPKLHTLASNESFEGSNVVPINTKKS